MNRINHYTIVKSKNLTELNLLDLAYIHLDHGGHVEVNDGYMNSSLPLILQEIRHAKGQRYSRSFLPVSAAYTVLDQLGFIYARNDMARYSDSNASSIKKALYYFCGFGENCRDTKTIYALRNSFLHNASLISKAERDNQPNHRFMFDSNLNKLISYPETDWDGDFENLDNLKNTTAINQNTFIDLVEDAVRNVRELFRSGKLDVTLQGGEIEFYYRFLTHQNN